MKATYALSKPTIVVGESTKLSLVVRFGAEGKKEDAPRRKLNLSLVLDRSGSMGGTPLRQAIKAAQALVGEMKEDDRVSVVIFDDSPDTIVDPVLAKDKKGIQDKIGKARAGGCTNLSGGWLEGVKHVKKHAKKDEVNRVLLLTDGQANMGITDPDVLKKTSGEKAGEGVVTTTLGFGSGFNEDLLIGMAREAEGNFYFIESPEDVEQVFKIELEGLSSVIGQNLVVSVRPDEVVEHGWVLNKYRIQEKGNELEVTLGDVYAVEDKVLALELEVKPTKAGPVKVASVQFQYQTVVDGSIKDGSGEFVVTVNAGTAEEAAAAAQDINVIGEARRLETAKLKDEAVDLADKGDLKNAAQKLRKMAEDLRNSPLANQFAFAEEIEQLEHFADRLEKRSYDGVLRKELRDQSYQAGARSRGDLAQRGTAGGSAAGLPTVTSADGGVVVRCEKEGGKLRIKVISDGFDASKNVQFPRAIRQEGVTYLVENVVGSNDGSFYRAAGWIKRLLRPGETVSASSGGSARRSSGSSSKAAKTPATAADLPTCTEIGDGVLVQCVPEGKKLRARVVSDGFNPNYNIRFPRSIRELGVLYVCDEVVEASGGGSYVAGGEIKRLIQ
ncbi:vWA domain-containing protein [Polyangium fumosum]|uniref:VWA domain-containing protein n=1 Tax=Polyangium fumosum TaxID=889272 RepID=A0A4U1JFI2_9BACT|nr:VWA domain-containing protein [Polyangium fumosum]TKD09795.1 VWA domain-containing protein [Polyangium fumosum]